MSDVTIALWYATAAMLTLFAAAHIQARKNGGIWFFRLGRLRASFCVARRAAADPQGFSTRGDLE